MRFLKASRKVPRTYDVIYNEDRNRPRGLILSLLAEGDVPGLQSQLAKLQPLPLEPQASIDAENKEQFYDKPLLEDKGPDDDDWVDIPPELQPVLMPSGLPSLAEGESIDQRVQDFDMDALDLKNVPDWDPDNSGEAGFYSVEALYTWIRADQEACAKGARPVLYESFSSPRLEQWGEPAVDHVVKNLAPILLICQIPACKPDEDFRTIYGEYAYMTSLEEWQRVSCFKQTHPSIPGWLLVQEFEEDLWQNRDYLDLKKQEAEYLWRKKGWEGVWLEFFRVRR